MRRKRQQLSDEAARQVLEQATSGVLAVMGDGGYPYAVPLSYVWHDGRLIFHSAVHDIRWMPFVAAIKLRSV